MTLPPPPLTLLDQASLFLDFDGTLIDFVIDPATATVDARLQSLIGSLIGQLDGRVAILSGRSLDDLTDRLGCGRIAMAGSHGLERRSADGTIIRATVPPELAAAQTEASHFAKDNGLLIETKPFGIAIHYRDSEHAEAVVDEFARTLAERSGLQLQKGKCVRELKVAGADKGDAVRAFMAEPPFASGSPVVMGDDLTDEDAFGAAAALGGCGVLVGDSRSSAARFRLPTVEATLDWLGRCR